VHVRLAPEALSRRVAAALLACCCMWIGCGRATGDVTVTWTIEPSPPVTAAATVVRITLRHDDGNPVRGAKLHLQAHMTHPGMAPVTGEPIERGAGEYEAQLRLSMAGPWVFVVTGELAEGGRITSQKDVAAVAPPG
jgi:hypothetical protein